MFLQPKYDDVFTAKSQNMTMFLQRKAKILQYFYSQKPKYYDVFTIKSQNTTMFLEPKVVEIRKILRCFSCIIKHR